MPIVVPCQCGKKLSVKEEMAGKRVRCPGCQQIVQVPVPEPEEEVPFATAVSESAPAGVSGGDGGEIVAAQVSTKRESPAVENTSKTMLAVLLGGAVLLVGCGLLGCIVGWFFWFGFRFEDANITRAKLDCKILQQAVSAYYTKNHGRFPQTLDELAERQPDGNPAYIQESMLLDPWGNPYILDVNTRHSVTGMPLIMSFGPPGQNIAIRNWTE